MGGFLSFRRKDPKTPIQGFGPRIKNVFLVHYKGIVGCTLTFALTIWQPVKGEHYITVQCMWIWMIIFYLFQPVNVPVTGFIPIFLLPMSGAMSSIVTCKCYFNENAALFVLGGWMLYPINQSGLDRRVILWFLCSGNDRQYSEDKIIFKGGTAAFFLSMFSSRQFVSKTIMEILSPAYNNLKSRQTNAEPDYNIMKYIVMNSIQISSTLGSLTIMHAAFTTITMRNIWCTHAGQDKEYPDIFNYLQYTVFAFPVAFVLFILCLIYHVVLCKILIKKPMAAASLTELKKTLVKHQDALPKTISGQIKLIILFEALFLIIIFSRWSPWIDYGWSSYHRAASFAQEVPGIKDITIVAIFVLIMHILPSTLNELKYFSAKTKSQLGPLKPESGIMVWRFLDGYTNYGYVFLIGSGVALNRAISVTKLDDKMVSWDFTKFITGQSFNISLLIVIIVTIIFANAMTGVAAVSVILPFVLNMSGVKPSFRRQEEGGAASAGNDWAKKAYIGAVCVGMAGAFGFMSPFRFTPAYYCRSRGKVPLKNMAIFSIVPLILCAVVLWVACTAWAPFVWDPNNEGFKAFVVVTTTPASSPGGI